MTATTPDRTTRSPLPIALAIGTAVLAALQLLIGQNTGHRPVLLTVALVGALLTGVLAALPRVPAWVPVVSAVVGAAAVVLIGVSYL